MAPGARGSVAVGDGGADGIGDRTGGVGCAAGGG
jgi:hypothetical protein